VDSVELGAVFMKIFQCVSLDKAVRVVWLRFNVYAGYVKAGPAIAFACTASATEQVK
jgi:hypothetical protein